MKNSTFLLGILGSILILISIFEGHNMYYMIFGGFMNVSALLWAILEKDYDNN